MPDVQRGFDLFRLEPSSRAARVCRRRCRRGSDWNALAQGRGALRCKSLSRVTISPRSGKYGESLGECDLIIAGATGAADRYVLRRPVVHGARRQHLGVAARMSSTSTRCTVPAML